MIKVSLLQSALLTSLFLLVGGEMSHLAAAAETAPKPAVAALFEPLQVGALHLPNRVIMAPLTRTRADDDLSLIHI